MQACITQWPHLMFVKQARFKLHCNFPLVQQLGPSQSHGYKILYNHGGLQHLSGNTKSELGAYNALLYFLLFFIAFYLRQSWQ